jgi:hypothetical protein
VGRLACVGQSIDYVCVNGEDTKGKDITLTGKL